MSLKRQSSIKPRRKPRILAPETQLKVPPEPAVEPCPFCQKAHWRVEFDSSTLVSWVECVSCLATGPAAQGPLVVSPRVAAIKAWNMRGPQGDKT